MAAYQHSFIPICAGREAARMGIKMTIPSASPQDMAIINAVETLVGIGGQFASDAQRIEETENGLELTIGEFTATVGG